MGHFRDIVKIVTAGLIGILINFLAPLFADMFSERFGCGGGGELLLICGNWISTYVITIIIGWVLVFVVVINVIIKSKIKHKLITFLLWFVAIVAANYLIILIQIFHPFS
jgi:hypothetical protein